MKSTKSSSLDSPETSSCKPRYYATTAHSIDLALCFRPVRPSERAYVPAEYIFRPACR